MVVGGFPCLRIYDLSNILWIKFDSNFQVNGRFQLSTQQFMGMVEDNILMMQRMED